MQRVQKAVLRIVVLFREKGLLMELSCIILKWNKHDSIAGK